MSEYEILYLPGGKYHYAEQEGELTLCGIEVNTLEAVASIPDYNDLCKRCKAGAGEATAQFTGHVVELVEEAPEEVQPAKGVKI